MYRKDRQGDQETVAYPIAFCGIRPKAVVPGTRITSLGRDIQWGGLWSIGTHLRSTVLVLAWKGAGSVVGYRACEVSSTRPGASKVRMYGYQASSSLCW